MYNEQQAMDLLNQLTALPPQRRRAVMQKRLDIVLHPEFGRLLATNIRHYSENVSIMAAMAARSGRFDMVARSEQSLNAVRQIMMEVEGLRQTATGRASAPRAAPAQSFQRGAATKRKKGCCCLPVSLFLVSLPLCAGGTLFLLIR